MGGRPFATVSRNTHLEGRFCAAPLQGNLETEFLPAIDRQWYRELPMRVVVRPLTREEELEVEAAYWQSVGDIRRAELAEERLQAVREASDSAEAKRGSVASGGQTDALPSQDEK